MLLNHQPPKAPEDLGEGKKKIWGTTLPDVPAQCLGISGCYCDCAYLCSLGDTASQGTGQADQSVFFFQSIFLKGQQGLSNRRIHSCLDWEVLAEPGQGRSVRGQEMTTTADPEGLGEEL